MVVQPREEGEDTAREVKRQETLVTRYMGKEFKLKPEAVRYVL